MPDVFEEISRAGAPTANRCDMQIGVNWTTYRLLEELHKLYPTVSRAKFTALAIKRLHKDIKQAQRKNHKRVRGFNPYSYRRKNAEIRPGE